MTITMIPETFSADVDFTSTRLTRPTNRAGVVATAATFAGRTLRQFVRTPQLLVVGALTSIMFLLIFRYVFGGAIGTGELDYVDFLIPGLAAAGALFSGTGGAVGVAAGRRQRPARPDALAADPALGRAARPLAGRHGAGRLGPVHHARRRCADRVPHPRLRRPRRRPPSGCASSTGSRSRGRSSTWA